MNSDELLFCRLMAFSLHTEKEFNTASALTEQVKNSLSALIRIAALHNMLPALYDSLCHLEVSFSAEYKTYFKQMIPNICYGCYDMLFFTKRVLSMLSELSITFYVLKGITLLPAYSKLEYRHYSDVDILVPDPQEYLLAKKHLLSRGFTPKKDLVDHHQELTYQDGNTTYLLELHSKLISTQGSKRFNRQLENICQGISPITEQLPEADVVFPMLPHTQNCLYLLLHMLQHFMSAGFGVRLLYDWTAYLETFSDKIDFESLKENIDRLGLSGFCNAVTQLCSQHLGLSPDCCQPLLSEALSKETLSDFMKDIFQAGEFGKSDSARLLIMTKSGGISPYLHEFHRQMKKRFPFAHRFFPIWPILWLITGTCFVWNNHFVRRTKTKTLLQTTKKRQHLLHGLKLFR